MAAAIEGSGRPKTAIRSAATSVLYRTAGCGFRRERRVLFSVMQASCLFPARASSNWRGTCQRAVRAGLAGHTRTSIQIWFDCVYNPVPRDSEGRVRLVVKAVVAKGADAQDLARQAEWRADAAERSAAERERRVARLEGAHEALDRAARAYHSLPMPRVTVNLRQAFVALERPRPRPGDQEDADRQLALRDVKAADRITRPPLSRLLMTTSHALPTYLSMVFVHNAEQGSSPREPRLNALRTANGPESWAVLCGRWVSGQRARRVRFMRDLDTLSGADLVALGGDSRRTLYEPFELLADDPSDLKYRPPGREEGSLPLPADLFLKGWHLVLTPAELAMLIVIRHAWRKHGRTTNADGVGIATSTRWNTYGISDEAYSTAHELAEFGLIELRDPMPNRRNGKIRMSSPAERTGLEADGVSLAPETYRFVPESDECFSRPALLVVNGCLTTSPVAPRHM